MNTAQSLKDQILSIFKDGIKETHIHCPLVGFRYNILDIISRYGKVMYVVKSNQVKAITQFLEAWNEFKTDVDNAVYPEDISKRRFESPITITSEDFLLWLMSNTNDYTFTNVIIFEEGLEINEKSKGIYHLWRLHVEKKPTILFFSDPHESIKSIIPMSHYKHQVKVKYLSEDLPESLLYDKVALLILNNYKFLVSRRGTKGCCIVVFIASIYQEIKIKERLSQIKDYVFSTLSDSPDILIKPITSAQFRAQIILTNTPYDVRSLSDVSVVIDLMTEEVNGTIRNISKYQATQRRRRVTVNGGVCYRMVSIKSFNSLPRVHTDVIRDTVILKIINKNVDEKDLRLLLGGDFENKTKLYQDMGFLDPEEMKLTTLGLKASNVFLKPRNFRFLNEWNKHELPLFPAVLITSLMEIGDHRYFLSSDRDAYSQYYGKDDMETFLNVIMNMFNEYKGVPDKTIESVSWVKEWSDLYNMDPKSFITIVSVINNTIRDLSYQGYEINTAPFDTKKALNYARDLIVNSHIVATLKKDKNYIDTNGYKYIFGGILRHSLLQDFPKKIAILAYTDTEVHKTRRALLVASTQKEVKVPILALLSYIDINKMIYIRSKLFKGVKPRDYIDDGDKVVRLISKKYIKSQINTADDISDPKTNFGVVYGPWYSPESPITRYVIRDGDFYTSNEIVEIEADKDTFSSNLTNKILPSRPMDSILSATVEWRERSNMLLATDYITEYVSDGESVIYIGNFNDHLSEHFPMVKFIVYSPSRGQSRDRVDYRRMFDLKNILNIDSVRVHIIHEGKNIRSTIEIIKQLKPKGALVRFSPSKYQNKTDFFEGELTTIPFSSMDSNETAVIIKPPYNIVSYDLNEYRSRMYYHNLILRQWKRFSPTVPFPRRDNLQRPERDYLCFDECYDCRREIGIHQAFLERKYTQRTYDKKLGIYDEIDKLSISLKHNRSLYYGLHGTFTSFRYSIDDRRAKYRARSTRMTSSFSMRSGLRIRT